MQCQCQTIKGTRCSRNAKAGSKYCWQHRNCKSPSSPKTKRAKKAKSPVVVRARSKSPSRTAPLVNLNTLGNLEPIELQQVLLNLDDASLGQACRTNKKFNAICQLDRFWELRSQLYFNNQLNLKREGESWRQFYQRLTIQARIKQVYILRWNSGNIYGIFDSPVKALKGLYYLLANNNLATDRWALLKSDPLNYNAALQYINWNELEDSKITIDSLPVNNESMSQAKAILTLDGATGSITSEPEFYHLPTYIGDGSGYVAIINLNATQIFIFPSLEEAIAFREANELSESYIDEQDIYWYALNGVPDNRPLDEIGSRNSMLKISANGVERGLNMDKTIKRV